MADVHTKEQRSLNMSRIKNRDTKPEVRLRSLLHKAGCRFRLHGPDLPGRPDIVLPKHRTVIFVNGCFWHRHEGCRFTTMPATRPEFWQNKFEGAINRDRRNRVLLEEAGWKVVTIWECDLKAFPDRTLYQVAEQLREPH